MGRPSVLKGRVILENDDDTDSLTSSGTSWHVRGCWIGGSVVHVGEGWIRVPEVEKKHSH